MQGRAFSQLRLNRDNLTVTNIRDEISAAEISFDVSKTGMKCPLLVQEKAIAQGVGGSRGGVEAGGGGALLARRRRGKGLVYIKRTDGLTPH